MRTHVSRVLRSFLLFAFVFSTCFGSQSATGKTAPAQAGAVQPAATQPGASKISAVAAQPSSAQTSTSKTSAAPASAAQPAGIPLPRQIPTARRIFISNGGVHCEWYIGPNRAYREFYSAMRQWGRYQLVNKPATASLDFQIAFSCPTAGTSVNSGQSSGTNYLPRLKLVIRDIETRTVLWTIVQPVRNALLQSNRDKNFQRAIDVLVLRLKNLADQLPAAEQPPVYHPRWPWAKIAVAASGLVIAIVIWAIAAHNLHQMQSHFPTSPQPMPFY